MLKLLKKPIPDITALQKSIDKIADELLNLKRNKQYKPTEADLRKLKILNEKLYNAYTIAGYVERTLIHRAENKPEGAAKWNNSDVAAYYNID